MGIDVQSYNSCQYHYIKYVSCSHCSITRDDTLHLFLDCPRFAAQRGTLFIKLAPKIVNLNIDLNNISGKQKITDCVKVLICENYQLDIESNRCIMGYLMEYISETNIFR